MRTHGWAGAAPASDEEAVARILAAAGKAIDERGADFSIADVARTLGVTRQTVYRYFPSTEALLVASGSQGIDAFLDDIAAHLVEVTDAATAVVEGIAYTYEQIHERSDLALLIASPGGPAHEVTAPTALALGRSILERVPVDWAAAGYVGDELDELVEQMLRSLQSFLVDPGSPPRSGAELRRYLHRWVGPAVTSGVSLPR